MRRRSPDYMLLAITLTILVFGLVMVFSASFVEAAEGYGDGYYFFKRQLAWALLGGIGLAVASQVDYRRWRGWAAPLLWAAFAGLALVLVPGIGRVVNGARRWIGVGSLSFQPAEAAKLALAVYCAHWLSRHAERVPSLTRGVLPYLGVVLAAAGLIMGEPDLGMAITLTGTALLMLFVAGARLGHLLLLALAAVPAGYVAIISEPYRARHFLSFLDPFADPLGSGYHIIQSLYALGSGGLFGVGLAGGRQKFYYLPERHTDFIFAVTGEELGFVGGCALLLLFLALAWRGFRIAATAPDRFGCLLACGITSMIMLQVLINVGVVTSTLPITGITLPFVSFGGSSLVFSLAGIGILLNISRYCKY